MARPDKEAAVAELADKFRSSGAVLLTEYRGLSVADLRTLRRSLAGNAEYAVVKNTLAAIAARQVGLEALADDLTGPTALTFVTGEPVEAAKALRDFAKENKNLVVKGGVMDGNVMDAADVDRLASLESREALLAKGPRDRVEDIVYFDPGDMSNPIGLNMFEFDHPDQKDFLVQEAINMLYGLYDPGHTGIVGPRLEHIFRNCALLLMADPAGGTFVDVPKLLVDEQFRNAKLKYVTDRQVLDFWTKEFPASQRSNEAGDLISWVISKFGPFISNDAMRNIIGQTKSGFNFPEIMNNKLVKDVYLGADFQL